MTMRQAKANEIKLYAYRKLAGELMWLGSGTLPQASCVASSMMQSLLGLTVDKLVMTNSALK